MKITFYGQNSLHLEISGKHIIVDPFISGNPLSKDAVDINSLSADYMKGNDIISFAFLIKAFRF